MNFEDTAEEANFRASVRSWLKDNAPWHLAEEIRQIVTPGTLPITSEDPMTACKTWQRRKAEAGYACPSWPREYGGGGMTPIQQVIWQQEEGLFAELSTPFTIGFGICGPTLITWADEDQKRKLLPPLVTGEELWCQLFSEPAAGSDLAGLRTKAEQAADGSGDWIVNGQKIWTSYAHLARWGLLLARTDPAAPKHKGMTMFFVAMDSPGIDIRPIRQINGQSHFNEVFFTDVRIPAAQLLGQPGQGWAVSMTTLSNERASIGSHIATGLEQLLDLARRLETPRGRAIDDPAVRSKLADWVCKERGLKNASLRAISAISRGEVPGPDSSVSKLVAAPMKQDICMFAVELMGRAGILTDPDLAGAVNWFEANLLRSPSTRIAGGSDQILRNIVAERILGLPGEIRVDKAVPFNEIPTRGRPGKT